MRNVPAGLTVLTLEQFELRRAGTWRVDYGVMSGDDWVKIVEKLVPVLTLLGGGLFTILGLIIRAGIEEKRAIKEFVLDEPKKRSVIIEELIGGVLTFQASAREAAQAWSKFKAWRDGFVSEQEALRQEFFRQRDVLRRDLVSLVAKAEAYGQKPDGVAGEPNLGLYVYEWGEAIVAELHDDTKDYNTYYRERGEELIAELRVLRQKERENQQRLVLAKKPKP